MTQLAGRTSIKRQIKDLGQSFFVFKIGFSVLGRADQLRCVYVTGIYVFLGVIDIFAVLMLGLVGSLSVNGLSGNAPGTRTAQVLEVVGLQGKTLQNQVGVLGLVAAAVLVSKSLVSLQLSRRTLLFLARRSAMISRDLISRLLGGQNLQIRQQGIQNTIFALTSGVQALIVSAIGSTLLLIADLFLIFAFSISLFLVDFLVGISSLIIFSSAGFGLFLIQHKKARELGKRAAALDIESANAISDVVLCYRELLVKNRREFYAEEIGRLRFDVSEAGAKMGVMSLLSKYVMEITMVFGGLLIGVSQFITQSSSRAVAVISIFIVTSTRIAPAILRIQTGLIGIRNSFALAEPTVNLIARFGGMNLREENSGKRGKALLPNQPNREHKGFVPKIEVKNLSFSYPGISSRAIDTLEFNVVPGEFIGVVGKSGAGKSTLIDLILGVLPPDSGEIFLSDVSPIQAYSSWPGAVAYVPQDTNLIDGTIKDNICLGFDALEVDDQIIIGLLDDVGLSELKLLPLGIHSSVGDRGHKLSGGQRQRIGIARALLTNPSLLILDEATSSLDSLTEDRITSFLMKEKGNRTMIVIAHRLSTVRYADKLVLLDSGRLSGIGKFEELKERVPDFAQQAKLMGL